MTCLIRQCVGSCGGVLGGGHGLRDCRAVGSGMERKVGFRGHQVYRAGCDLRTWGAGGGSCQEACEATFVCESSSRHPFVRVRCILCVHGCLCTQAAACQCSVMRSVMGASGGDGRRPSFARSILTIRMQPPKTPSLGLRDTANGVRGEWVQRAEVLLRMRVAGVSETMSLSSSTLGMPDSLVGSHVVEESQCWHAGMHACLLAWGGVR